MRHWSIRRAMSVVEPVMGEDHRGASSIARRGQTESSHPDAVPHPQYRPTSPPSFATRFLAHEVKSRDSRMLDRHAWTRAVLPTGVPNQQMIPTQVEEVPGHERLGPSGHACSCRAASC
jgi:hypothetical protein